MPDKKPKNDNRQRLRELSDDDREVLIIQILMLGDLGVGGLARNRTGVQGFAVLCVTTPPRGLNCK